MEQIKRVAAERSAKVAAKAAAEASSEEGKAAAEASSEEGKSSSSNVVAAAPSEEEKTSRKIEKKILKIIDAILPLLSVERQEAIEALKKLSTQEILDATKFDNLKVTHEAIGIEVLEIKEDLQAKGEKYNRQYFERMARKLLTERRQAEVKQNLEEYADRVISEDAISEDEISEDEIVSKRVVENSTDKTKRQGKCNSVADFLQDFTNSTVGEDGKEALQILSNTISRYSTDRLYTYEEEEQLEKEVEAIQSSNPVVMRFVTDFKKHMEANKASRASVVSAVYTDWEADTREWDEKDAKKAAAEASSEDVIVAKREVKNSTDKKKRQVQFNSVLDFAEDSVNNHRESIYGTYNSVYNTLDEIGENLKERITSFARDRSSVYEKDGRWYADFVEEFNKEFDEEFNEDLGDKTSTIVAKIREEAEVERAKRQERGKKMAKIKQYNPDAMEALRNTAGMVEAAEAQDQEAMQAVHKAIQAKEAAENQQTKQAVVEAITEAGEIQLMLAEVVKREEELIHNAYQEALAIEPRTVRVKGAAAPVLLPQEEEEEPIHDTMSAMGLNSSDDEEEPVHFTKNPAPAPKPKPQEVEQAHGIMSAMGDGTSHLTQKVSSSKRGGVGATKHKSNVPPNPPSQSSKPQGGPSMY